MPLRKTAEALLIQGSDRIVVFAKCGGSKYCRKGVCAADGGNIFDKYSVYVSPQANRDIDENVKSAAVVAIRYSQSQLQDFSVLSEKLIVIR